MNSSTTPISACTASAISYPDIFGAQILSLSANPVLNFTSEVTDQLYYNNPSVSVKNLDYCNVTVTYTHLGQNDTIVVETWLPMKTWNGRLQAIGGGGWVAGRFALSYVGMAGALGQGYATTTTDGGIGSSYTPDLWALNSPGNVDLYALQNFASVSLNDQAMIAKEIINSYYGQPPAYSYWSGCSQGGRQGLMLAQRYPDDYNGIAASAPAINWSEMIAAGAWAQVIMHLTKQYPAKCELDALTAAVVAACDPLDGITDGIISDLEVCNFDPFSAVGQNLPCPTGQNTTISLAAATIANHSWTGPRTVNNDSLWSGVGYQSQLTAPDSPRAITNTQGWAQTVCSTNGICVGKPLGLGEEWLRLFIKKNPDWNYTLIQSIEEFTSLFHASIREFNSIAGTKDPDLSAFRDIGGKLIGYHGLADGIIPVGGARDYYNRVTETTSNPQDFFRYFEVPGLGHCAGGAGGLPTTTFQALVDWVKKDIVPETLTVSFNDTTGVLNERIFCPYPAKVELKACSLDTTKAESFECSA